MDPLRGWWGVRVTDTLGLTGTSTATVNVSNVAPTATFSAPATAFAGLAFSLSLSNPTDSSPADAAAGFTYSFNCGTGYGSFGSVATASCVRTTTGSIGVSGTIRDKDGGTSEYLSTVSVVVTFQSLCTLTRALVTKQDVEDSLCEKLASAEAAAATGGPSANILNAYRKQVAAQTGKSISSSDAQLLTSLSLQL